jgi:adenine-specific DNA-methyltransferase
MAKTESKQREKKKIETLTHNKAKRRNIPTAEFQSVMRVEEQSPIRMAYERRNRDLDPQLVWRGKDEQDWSDLVVHAPPLYIQEKVQPKVLIDDLRRRTESDGRSAKSQFDLFADFNGLPSEAAKTEFYQHDAHWSNRLILGDSLQVMASLAEREGLRGQVQCIYIDPPYGIKFNSNFQWSTTSRDVKDGNIGHITREPEQVKAFRDTWRDGVHSYLTYLRDRLTVARDLLNDSGSIFLQIGDENVHRIRELMDEVFGNDNFVSLVTLKKTAGQDERLISNVSDYIIWFAKHKNLIKFRQSLTVRSRNLQELGQYTRIELTNGVRRPTDRSDFSSDGDLETEGRPFRLVIATSSGHGGNTAFPVNFHGKTYLPTANRHWSTHPVGFARLIGADRITTSGATLGYVRFFDDFIAQAANNIWGDLGTATEKKYVVETAPAVIQRCILMTTDPGDLILDPTCGSGTSAYVAEQWGRRWITVDTSRVALALARARIMGARYPYYVLSDSREGQVKEAEVTKNAPSEAPTHGNIRQGFVYERVPHIPLKSIANNAEIDVICDEYQRVLEPLREGLNAALKVNWQEWEIPRDADEKWSHEAKEVHAEGGKTESLDRRESMPPLPPMQNPNTCSISLTRTIRKSGWQDLLP